MKLCDLTGLTFGKLTVVKRGQDYVAPSGSRMVRWQCICSCGQTVLVYRRHLQSGHTRSCGCFRRSFVSKTKWRGCGDLAGSFWNTIKRGAIERELAFQIEIEEVWNLFIEQDKCCALTGVRLSMCRKFGKPGSHLQHTASLDRIDSNKGYTLDNVRWVHKSVNLMRLDMTDEEFYQWCLLIVQHRKHTEVQFDNAA